MDSKDRRIIYEIAENARESHNLIAKKLRISREVLDYRIKNMEREGIISGYQARINILNFVYGGYIILVQSFGIGKETERKIVDKIKHSIYTRYIGKIGGGFDFIIGFTSSDINSLSEYIEFVNGAFGKNKSKITFLTMVKELKDSFKSFFSDVKEENTLVSMPINSAKTIVDDLDREILLKLGEDCSVPTWKVLKEKSITEVAVRKRIKKLVDQGVIINFRTMINLTKLDRNVNFLFLKTNFIDSSSERSLEKTLFFDKRITYATKLIGEYDYVITILTKDNVELNDFTNEVKSELTNSIKSIEILPLFQMVYHSQLKL